MTGRTSPVAHPALVGYPRQAVVGRALPKNKLYEYSKANTRLKDLFVREVEQIVWQYKLAPETINLPARPGVPEIQVFSLQLKAPDLNRDVLRAIDGAVQFPILFELGFEGRTRVVACYKRPNETDPSRWVLSDYFETDWIESGAVRAGMPLAVELAGLYEQLLYRLIPLRAHPGETMAALVTRFELVQAGRREVARAAARLAKEKQFNRKVEINAALRKLNAELEQLSR